MLRGMDALTRTIKAALLYEDGVTLDSVVIVPLIGGCPPGEIRVATTFGGALAYDVYELDDDEEFSSMPAYPYKATVPVTTADLDD
jgi:hypothetical protein